MKIIKIETIRIEEFPNVCFVQIHTDEGIVGLGETYLGQKL
jgi:galactonate dehydratase